MKELDSVWRGEAPETFVCRSATNIGKLVPFMVMLTCQKILGNVFPHLAFYWDFPSAMTIILGLNVIKGNKHIGSNSEVQKNHLHRR